MENASKLLCRRERQLKKLSNTKQKVNKCKLKLNSNLKHLLRKKLHKLSK